MSDNRCDLCGESLSLAEYRTGECMNCFEGIATATSSDPQTGTISTNIAGDSNPATSSDDDLAAACRDMVRTGTGVMKDGKRIDPKEFFATSSDDKDTDSVTAAARNLIEFRKGVQFRSLEMVDAVIAEQELFKALDEALNSATSSERVSISREQHRFALECMEECTHLALQFQIDEFKAALEAADECS